MIWSTINSHNKIVSKAYEFGICNGITFINKQDDGCEFFFLGTSQNDVQTLNNIILNVEQIKKFILYFGNKFKQLETYLMTYKTKSNDMKQNVLKFSIMNNFNKYLYIADLYDLKITLRETEVIRFLIEGCTAKQIGKELDISLRTVETHIINLKNKTNTHDKQSLVNKLNFLFK